MDISTTGIVIKQMPYQDSSIIARIYTLSEGLVSFIVKGVRKKSKTRGISHVYFQPLTVLELSFNYRPNKSLQNLYKAKIYQINDSLSSNIAKSAIVFFLADFLHLSLKEQADKNIYKFLFNAIQLLNKHNKCANFHLAFLAHFTKPLGFFPVIEDVDSECVIFDKNEGIFFNAKNNLLAKNYFDVWVVFKMPFELFEELKLTSIQRNNVLEELLEYYSIHLGIGIPKSLRVLKELLE